MTKNSKYILLLIVLSYFFLMFGNWLVSLTNPDEVFYTLTAKEMSLKNSWATPYLFGQPQFEKPILLYWLMRVAFLVWGITNFAARFTPALFGMFGVLAVYFLGLLGFRNEKKAFISALVLMSSGLYIGLSRTVFTDMLFSVLILSSLLVFFWGFTARARKNLSLLLFFVFAGFATLAKGPLGIIIPFSVIVIFLIAAKELKYLFCKEILWGLLVFSIISLPWYLLMVKKYGPAFINEFFYNDHIRRFVEAEHISNDTWFFYPFSMLGCMFPWSLFVGASLFCLFKNIRQSSPIQSFLISWIGVTFLIFQPAHSKLVSYIFPLFPALALVSGEYIYETVVRENMNRRFFLLSLITVVIISSMLVGSYVASLKFNGYLSSRMPVYFFICVLLVLCFFLWFSLLRRKFFKVIYLLACFVPVFLSVIPLVEKDIEPYVSSKQACEYLTKNYDVHGIILASKFYARGVRYYTGKEVAVIDVPGSNYFSPHPIPFLNNDQKVFQFLRKQGVTYCVLKKGSFEDIKRITIGSFKYNLLKVIGDEYLVKIEAF